jgi:glucose-1-phosphate thymidylyltransferase
MKVIILAAGYATRLYPLTLTQPKPLLPVAGKPMVEHVLDNLAPITEIDRVYVVTNAKFAGHFQKWSDNYRATKSKFNFTVVNDGSTNDTNKLGAIGDINHVLKVQNVDDDLIVVAGDNLFSEKLGDFGKFCRAKNAPALAVYDVGNLEEIKKYNSITTDANGRVTFFE